MFHAATMESGGLVGANLEPLTYYTSPVENLTRITGCWTGSNQLSCLRLLSSTDLFAAHPSQVWNPIVDEDFLTAYPSTLMSEGKFIKVPLLVGANSDEGVSFGVHALNITTATFNSLMVWVPML